MEGRMTICNMSIEFGSRGGLIALDETTFEYIRSRKFAPKGITLEKKIEKWKMLKSDNDAIFDKEIIIDARDIKPMITYGTNPGMGIAIGESIPQSTDEKHQKALKYMGLENVKTLENLPINYVFIGSCTNSRIEDFRVVAKYVKGKQKAPHVKALLVPGSQSVLRQIEKEGIKEIIEEAGFELRQPGCSACLAMNDDKIPEGEYCVSTSNRNFEGRQGHGARTILASPLTAAMVAVAGKIISPNK